MEKDSYLASNLKKNFKDELVIINDDILNIDRAMRWGFAWSKGPFEILDEIGIENFVSKLNQDEKTPSFIKQLIDQKKDSRKR